jgi:dihydroorotate dehydrogenase
VNIYHLFRALLFQLDPEYAHKMTLRAMQLAGEIRPVNVLLRSIYRIPNLPVQAFGINFINPIGLAAGYDKDGLGWRGLASLGFGHIEIGTVTPKPQPGNPRPRLFRLREDHALINRMGFPGMGSEFVLKQISRPHPKNLVLGVNIGKNKDTPLDTAIQDYLYLLRLFANHADYMTINVSSPNTVGLRQLQERQALNQLCQQLCVERELISLKADRRIPILVKLSPDLSDPQLDDALDVILRNQMDGVIATNTTTSRNGLAATIAHEEGGLSGGPLFERSLTMMGKIQKLTDGKLPVIGVGGISDANGVQKMMDAGAILVQIYTGLVYQGPGLVKRILNELHK